SRSQLTEDLKEALKEAKRGASASVRHRRSLNALVVIEISLALVLVSGAGLRLAPYKDQQQHVQFFERALAKIRALPGVEAAAGTFRVPIAGFATAIFSVEGKPVPTGQAHIAAYRA